MPNYDIDDEQDKPILDKRDMSLLNYFARRDPPKVQEFSEISDEQVLRYVKSYGMTL